MRQIPILVCAGILATSGLRAQMIDPSIDRENEPFCYFSKPVDVIGVMDGKEGTLVSPEGYFYTGWGELMFFTGNPPTPVDQRVKTLFRGFLPIVDYAFEKEGIRYSVEAFGATLDGRPESCLINFIRVTMQNRSRERRTATFSAGLRYEGPSNTTWGVADNRFGRPAKAEILGQYEQAGAEFSREWTYSFENDAVLRDGALMYTFPPSPVPLRFMTLKTGYNEKQGHDPEKLYVTPTTPVGIVEYTITLLPGASQVLEFRMPYEPIPPGHPDAKAIREASFDVKRQETVDFWEKIFARGIDIAVPETKVADAFRANLVYDCIARNKVDSFYIQKVNEFQYDAFWLRDASFIARMYDLSGYHDFARQCLDFFPRWQQPDGNFVSHGGQFDGWGQVLWIYGRHFRITHDTAFARTVYPSVRRAVEWLRAARAGDSLHLIPKTIPGDNEEITGHVTGHNFWALSGLKNAVVLAEAIGRADDAIAYRQEYDDLRTTLLRHLKEVTKKTKGYIPPGVEGPGGQDWGNMMAVHPEEHLDPFDPMVTATLDSTRAKYQEGLMTYGNGRWLHHYLTMKNTETELVRGEQQRVIEDLYAVLLHTSATHAGFEFSILPWSTRDFGMNLSPHGWFSAVFRTLLRNMMVREEGEDLHVLSCVSPEWVKDGDSISVRRAATDFGDVHFSFSVRGATATLKLDPRFVVQPKSIVVHVPWFVDVRSVRVDDRPGTVRNGAIAVPAGTKTVTMAWTKKAGTPALSYDAAVRGYLKEYRRRYEEFLRDGKQVY